MAATQTEEKLDWILEHMDQLSDCLGSISDTYHQMSVQLDSASTFRHGTQMQTLNLASMAVGSTGNGARLAGPPSSPNHSWYEHSLPVQTPAVPSASHIFDELSWCHDEAIPDEISHVGVVWDEDVQHGSDSYGLLQQIAQGVDNQMQGKQVISKAPITSEVATVEVFPETPLADVIWDKELHEFHSFDRSVAHPEEMVSMANLLCETNAYNVLEDRAPANVVGDVDLLHEPISYEVLLLQLTHGGQELIDDKFNKKPLADVVWDEDTSTELNMNNLLQQLTWCEGYSDGEHTNLIMAHTTGTVLTHVHGLSPSQELSVVAATEEFTAMPHKPVVWDEDMPSDLNVHDGVLCQLLVGREYMAKEQMKSAGLDIYTGLLQQFALGEEYMKIPIVSAGILTCIEGQEGLLKPLVCDDKGSARCVAARPPWSQTAFSPGNKLSTKNFRFDVIDIVYLINLPYTRAQSTRQWDPGILGFLMLI